MSKIQFKGQLQILLFSPSELRVSHEWVLDLISAECKHENEHSQINQYLEYKPLLKIDTAPRRAGIIRIWWSMACRDWRELSIPIFTSYKLYSTYSSNRSKQLLHQSFFLSFFLSFTNSQMKLIRHFVINESPNQSMQTIMLYINITAIQVFFLMNTLKPKAKPHSNIHFQ